MFRLSLDLRIITFQVPMFLSLTKYVGLLYCWEYSPIYYLIPSFLFFFSLILCVIPVMLCMTALAIWMSYSTKPYWIELNNVRVLIKLTSTKVLCSPAGWSWLKPRSAYLRSYRYTVTNMQSRSLSPSSLVSVEQTKAIMCKKNPKKKPTMLN